MLLFKKYLFFPQGLKFGDSIASRFIDVCNVSWGPWEDLVVSEPESDFLEKQILEISDSQKKKKKITFSALSTESDPWMMFLPTVILLYNKLSPQ